MINYRTDRQTHRFTGFERIVHDGCLHNGEPGCQTHCLIQKTGSHKMKRIKHGAQCEWKPGGSFEVIAMSSKWCVYLRIAELFKHSQLSSCVPSSLITNGWRYSHQRQHAPSVCCLRVSHLWKRLTDSYIAVLYSSARHNSVKLGNMIVILDDF